MTSKLTKTQKAARAAIPEDQRKPWEDAFARIFHALPDFCEDVAELKISFLEMAMRGMPVADAEEALRARALAVPACPVPAIPPCPV